MPPDPIKVHQQRTPQEWQQYMEAALKAHRQNPQDHEALDAIRQASESLNAYDKEGVEQSKLSSIPDELATVGHGAKDALTSMPGGIATLLHDLGKGRVYKAVGDVAGGVKQTAKGALAPWELAMRELGGETVPSDERNTMLHNAGGSLTGLEAIALPGQISRAAGAIKGSGGLPKPLGMKGGPVSGEPSTTPVDVSKLGENEFMQEYRKNTMTPDQADPYGLMDRPEKVKSPDPIIQPHHDMLSPEEMKTGPAPMTPEELNKLLEDVTKPKKGTFSTKDMDNDITPKGQEFPHGRIPPKPRRTNFGNDDIMPDEPDALDFASRVPGKVGNFAKLGKLMAALPDATTVRNKALTGALKSTIFSGMNPDSARTR